MDKNGLNLASRFSFPPNDLHLCGPEKQKDLKYYASTLNTDKGTGEILMQFSTLYPYLKFIASGNHIKDPFNEKVVEAYWLGNDLLRGVPFGRFIRFLDDDYKIKKNAKKKDLENIYKKILLGGSPHHSFHVLNIYKRTGNMNIPHTLATADACIINWGKVVKMLPDKIIVETQPLTIINNKISFGTKIRRMIKPQDVKDVLFAQLRIGQMVSYHWGKFCQRLTRIQLKNLIYYTRLSIALANNEKNCLFFRECLG